MRTAKGLLFVFFLFIAMMNIFGFIHHMATENQTYMINNK